MDSETEAYFSKMNTTIAELSSVVKEDIAYRKGLDIPVRMKVAETDIESLEAEKASWKGLAGAISLVIVMLGIVLTIAKGIK